MLHRNRVTNGSQKNCCCQKTCCCFCQKRCCCLRNYCCSLSFLQCCRFYSGCGCFLTCCSGLSCQQCHQKYCCLSNGLNNLILSQCPLFCVQYTLLSAACGQTALVIGNRSIMVVTGGFYAWKKLSEKCLNLCRNNKNRSQILCRKEKITMEKQRLLEFIPMDVIIKLMNIHKRIVLHNSYLQSWKEGSIKK